MAHNDLCVNCRHRQRGTPKVLVATMDILPPWPAKIDDSYPPFGFYKFGLWVWQYGYNASNPNQLYDGRIEWITTQHFCTTPEWPDVKGYRYHLRPGVQASLKVVPWIREDIPDTIINGVAINLIRGTGLPLVLPW